MNNADLPAMAVKVVASVAEQRRQASTGDYSFQDCQFTGLTKREMFAMHAMQGFSANPELTEEKGDIVARCAVLQADALLKALEEDGE